MSWCKCQVCHALINSDFDPACFVETGNMRRLHIEMIMCERCRDEYEERLEAERDAASRGELSKEA